MSALVDSGAQLAGAVEEELKDSGGAELQQDSDSVLASASATLATLGDPRAPSPSTATTLPTEMEGPAGGAGVPVLVAAALMTGQDDHQHEDRMDTDNNNSPSHVPIDQQTHSAAFSVSSNSTLNQLGSNLGAARLAGTTGAGSVHSEEYSAFDDEDQDLDSEADDRHSLSPVSPNINHGTAGMQGDDSTPRSETVCWACRIRKLGCNRALPTCSRCAKAGSVCAWSRGQVGPAGQLAGISYTEMSFEEYFELRDKEEAHFPQRLVACDNCRTRKRRCKGGKPGTVCMACQRFGTPCLYEGKGKKPSRSGRSGRGAGSTGSNSATMPTGQTRPYPNQGMQSPIPQHPDSFSSGSQTSYSPIGGPRLSPDQSLLDQDMARRMEEAARRLGRSHHKDHGPHGHHHHAHASSSQAQAQAHHRQGSVSAVAATVASAIYPQRQQPPPPQQMPMPMQMQMMPPQHPGMPMPPGIPSQAMYEAAYRTGTMAVPPQQAPQPMFPTFTNYMEQIREQAEARSSAIRQSAQQMSSNTTAGQQGKPSMVPVQQAMQAAMAAVHASSQVPVVPVHMTASNVPDYRLPSPPEPKEFKAPISGPPPVASHPASMEVHRPPSAWLPAMDSRGISENFGRLPSGDLLLPSPYHERRISPPYGSSPSRTGSSGSIMGYPANHRRASQPGYTPPFFPPFEPSTSLPTYGPPLLPPPRSSFSRGLALDPFPVPRSTSQLFSIADAGPPLPSFSSGSIGSGVFSTGYRSGVLGPDDPPSAALRVDSGVIASVGSMWDRQGGVQGLWDGETVTMSKEDGRKVEGVVESGARVEGQ